MRRVPSRASRVAKAVVVPILIIIAASLLGHQAPAAAASSSGVGGNGSSSWRRRGLLAADACANFCAGKASGLYANPCDTTCSSFFNCANGQTYLQSCSTGLRFNPTAKVCDWPANVVCSTNPSPSPTPPVKKSPFPPPAAKTSPSPPQTTNPNPPPPKARPSPLPPKVSPSPPLKASPSPPPPETSPYPPPQGGCPVGWSPAVGTVYDSWPKPGTTECVAYSGCTWAGMFNSLDGGSGPPCKNGAKWLDGGNGKYDCRFPEALVRNWSMAATYQLDKALLGQKIQVMVQGKPGATVTVNVKDVCSDADCDGCCKTNTSNKKWKLIDIEKWPAATLLGFDPTPRHFDINNVNLPSAVGLRPGAPESAVMPLCYWVLGPADPLV